MAVIGGIFDSYVPAASKDPLFAAGRIGPHRFYDVVAVVLCPTAAADTDQKDFSATGPAGGDMGTSISACGGTRRGLR